MWSVGLELVEVTARRQATVEATFYPFSRVSAIVARNPRVYVDGFVQSSDISWASGEWFVTIDGRDVPIPLGIDEGETYTSHCLAFSEALREKMGYSGARVSAHFAPAGRGPPACRS
jgi:hypothetical protein